MQAVELKEKIKASFYRGTESADNRSRSAKNTAERSGAALEVWCSQAAQFCCRAIRYQLRQRFPQLNLRKVGNPKTCFESITLFKARLRPF